MKTKLFFLCLIVMGLSSCGSMRVPVSKSSMIPKAINTVNSVSLQELNLKHGVDYKILNTVTSEAVVTYSVSGNVTLIQEANGEFALSFITDKKTGEQSVKCDGVARYGFLSKDYGSTQFSDNPEYVSRNLAVYRLINAVKVANADGVIEPLISSNVEQHGKSIIIKTIATAKLVKLNTDK